MKLRAVTFTIDSSYENVSLIGLAVNKICQSLSLSDVDSYKAELCVIEAVNNSIEHAYRGQSGSTVSVIVRIFSDRITFDICDTGRKYKPDLEPSLSFDPNDISNLPEGGMGRYLIMQIMDVVEYDHVNSHNILKLTKYLAKDWTR